MDQAQTEAAVGGEAGVPLQKTATWAAWEEYYREASRRRRARGGMRSLRRESKRRRVRERATFIGVTTVTGILILAFYLVLGP